MPAGSVAGVAALLLLTIGSAFLGVRGSLAGARSNWGRPSRGSESKPTRAEPCGPCAW